MSPEQSHVSWRKRSSLPGGGTTRTKVLSAVGMSCIPGRDRRVGGLPKSAAGGHRRTCYQVNLQPISIPTRKTMGSLLPKQN